MDRFDMIIMNSFIPLSTYTYICMCVYVYIPHHVFTAHYMYSDISCVNQSSHAGTTTSIYNITSLIHK